MVEKDTKTHEIIEAAIEVHNIIVPCKFEAVYQECLGIEFKRRNITFVAQPQLKFIIKNLSNQ